MAVTPSKIGSAFEELFKMVMVNQGWTVSKYGTEGRFVGKKFIPQKGKVDFLFYNDRFIVHVDTKTITADTFYPDWMTDHQVAFLRNLNSRGHIAGLVIWFRETDQIVFYWGLQVSDHLVYRRPLRPSDGILMGKWRGFSFDPVTASPLYTGNTPSLLSSKTHA